MDRLDGQVLSGRYRLVALLGEGGMGAVYRAQDLTLKREVAVKVMSSRLARQHDFKQRFLNEAQTAAKLNHPGVVQVHDFGQHNQLLYIVMEFIPGDNLREMLRKLQKAQQWIPLSEALNLVRQTSLTVDYIHHHKVLHRDIKPANLMLKPEASDGLPYRPVLTDLGLAKLVEGGLSTQTGTSMGTPAYMSPEQALGEETDARSDVYSLGILLYELAVGRLPFQVRSLTEAIRSHTKEPPPPPRSLRPELPEALEQVILKTLAKAPQQRYTDAKTLAEALTKPELVKLTGPSQVTAQTFAAEVSLMTRYQESLIGERGASILRDFSQVPVDVSGDAVQVMAPDGTIQAVPMLPQGLRLGRKADNDLVLDDPKVSGRHARIEFDGLSYRVIDQDSTNGTYLANTRLLPGVPEVWSPDKALRVGRYWLRLRRGQKAQTGTMLSGGGTMIDPASIHSSPGGGRVGVFLEKSHFTVEPGKATTIPLVILNQSEVVDHFQVEVAGVPQEWVQIPATAPELLPGGQEEVQLTLKPPQAPQSRADDYPLVIRVSSQDTPDQVAELHGTLTVTPFYQSRSEVRPQRVKAGQKAQVVIENQGNTAQTYTAKWQDRANELAFEPLQARLAVAGGETAVARFEASPRQRRWIGGAKTHSVSIKVTAPNEKEETLTSEVVSQGLIPIWVPPLLLFLCVVLSAAAAFAYNTYLGQISATATALAVAATQTAQTNTTATATAATAIALADTDGDGLTDIEEQRLGTNPQLPDTDEDGLKDKAEVDGNTDPTNPDTDGDELWDGDELKQRSDPRAIDTDGDTILDGAEVFGWEKEGEVFTTSPIKDDTDGDGLKDKVDPDPGNLPTPTPTNTPTATPNATATAQVISAATAEQAKRDQQATVAAAQATAEQAKRDQQGTAEAQKLAEEAAARQTQEEARRQAEEEARRQAEEEAKRQAEEEVRRQAEEEVLQAQEACESNPPITITPEDGKTIDEGQIVVLKWEVRCIREIFLNDKGVLGEGSVEVRPSPPSEIYTWRIMKTDGTSIQVKRTIFVNAKLPDKPPPQIVTIKLTDYSHKARWEGAQLTDASGNGKDQVSLPWMGAENDDRGFVRLTNINLEDGTNRLALRTHPKWVPNGTIKGWHPWIKAPQKATFESQVGFVKGATGTDGVRFIVFVHYIKDGRERWHSITELYKGYTGRLETIRGDISEFAGQEISIELRVDATVSAGQDWAVWVDPVIKGEQ